MTIYEFLRSQNGEIYSVAINEGYRGTVSPATVGKVINVNGPEKRALSTHLLSTSSDEFSSINEWYKTHQNGNGHLKNGKFEKVTLEEVTEAFSH